MGKPELEVGVTVVFVSLCLSSPALCIEFEGLQFPADKVTLESILGEGEGDPILLVVPRDGHLWTCCQGHQAVLSYAPGAHSFVPVAARLTIHHMSHPGVVGIIVYRPCHTFVRFLTL